MRQRTIIAAAITAFLTVVAGAPSAGIAQSHAGTRTEVSSGIPGCAPLCLTPNLMRPGNLTAGKYQTRYFFAGQMTLSVPKRWLSEEDSTGEFAAWPRGKAETRVIFWEDVYATRAVTPGSWPRVGPLRPTSASLLAWLQKNPNLTVSKPITGKIGVLPARLVDVGVSDGAMNDDPGCPVKACVNFVRFPQWEGPYGVGSGGVSRFYLSDVRYGGQRHLFVAVIEGTNRAQLTAFLPIATRVFESVRVPAAPG